MRNKIILTILLIVITLLLVVMFRGIEIGKFKILSVSQLKEKNEKLEQKITTASTLTSIEYPKSEQTLETTYNEYKIQKHKYEELSEFAGDEESQIYETKQYDIGYLWKTIGKYATKHNLVISMDVKNGSTASLYDLHFSVTGEYVNISQFIANIENNSDLYFRIYNFKMNGSSRIVNSSFTVKDINIDPSTLSTIEITE